MCDRGPPRLRAGSLTDDVLRPGQLNTEVSYAITLQNTSTRLVAFKVKTTAPKRYMVRYVFRWFGVRAGNRYRLNVSFSPNQGYIRPGETSPVSIILVRQTQYPDASNPRNVRDKFLVQSMPVDRVPPFA